jgi:hypothetical protein
MTASRVAAASRRLGAAGSDDAFFPLPLFRSLITHEEYPDCLHVLS